MPVKCRSRAGSLSKRACATTRNCFAGPEELSQNTQKRKEEDEHELAHRSLLLGGRLVSHDGSSGCGKFPLVLAFRNPHGRGFCPCSTLRPPDGARPIRGHCAGTSHCDPALHLVRSDGLFPAI